MRSRGRSTFASAICQSRASESSQQAPPRLLDWRSTVRASSQRILTINGGSSSIKFALFEPAGDSMRRIVEGAIERIGLPDAAIRVKGLKPADNFSRAVTAPDHTAAVGALMDWIEARSAREALTAIGHRVVHGGPRYSEPERITSKMIDELHRLSPFDPE